MQGVPSSIPSYLRIVVAPLMSPLPGVTILLPEWRVVGGGEEFIDTFSPSCQPPVPHEGRNTPFIFPLPAESWRASYLSLMFEEQ